MTIVLMIILGKSIGYSLLSLIRFLVWIDFNNKIQNWTIRTVTFKLYEFLAAAEGSNPTGPYLYRILSLQGSSNIYWPNLKWALKTCLIKKQFCNYLSIKYQVL